MSYPHDSGQPPPEPRRSDQQVHEHVVERVRELSREAAIIIPAAHGADTGWRQVFPVTYDIPSPPAEAVHAAEDDGPPPPDLT